MSITIQPDAHDDAPASDLTDADIDRMATEAAPLDLLVLDSEGEAQGRWLVACEADAFEAQATDRGYASYAEALGDGVGRGWTTVRVSGLDLPWWLAPVAWSRSR